MDNIHLNTMAVVRNEMFVQANCEKHEYVEVTQTTSSTITPNKPITWLQCKHCGKIKDHPFLKSS